MAYDSPSASQLRSNAESRHAQSRSRLMNLMAARQQRVDELAAEQEALLAQQQREVEEQQNEGSRNWLGSAASGAMIGSMFNPGLGTAIGGGVGALAGIAGSYMNRQDQNKGEGKLASLGKAFAHPMGDKFDGVSDLPIQQAAVMAMNHRKATPAKSASAAHAKALEDWNNAQANASLGGPGGPTLGASPAPSAPGDYNSFDSSMTVDKYGTSRMG